MNITFVAPRFHTNQIPVVEILKKNGHNVTYIVQYYGQSEDYTLLTPVRFKKNIIFRLRYYFYKKNNPNPQDPFKFERKYGMPSKLQYFKFFALNRPDLVIIRDDHLKISKLTFAVCKILNIKTILYLQKSKSQIIENFESHSVRAPQNMFSHHMSPQVIMTPLAGKLTDTTSKIAEHIYHIPFAVKLNEKCFSRKYFNNDYINLISVGKFVPRKRHLLLLKVIAELKEKYPVHLTIIGEVSTENHQEELNKNLEFIKNNKLEEVVQIKTNLKYNDVCEEYLINDLFVMAAIDEPMPISPLEAMACGLPVICSDTSGAREYIQENYNGSIYRSDDYADLVNKIEHIISDKRYLQYMGQNSCKLIQEKYSQEKYYSSFMRMVKSEFNLE